MRVLRRGLGSGRLHKTMPLLHRLKLRKISLHNNLPRGLILAMHLCATGVTAITHLIFSVVNAPTVEEMVILLPPAAFLLTRIRQFRTKPNKLLSLLLSNKVKLHDLIFLLVRATIVGI